jgi:peptide/nickel transport system ATP-binding protein
MPSMDPAHRTEEAPLSGDPPNPIDPPDGCRFHPRCKLAVPMCGNVEPALFDAGGGHFAACHLANPASGHPGARQSVAA